MSRRGESAEEISEASVSSQNNTADKRNRTKIINVVYLVAALDITWLFLQFSVTPVSISNMSDQEAEISVTAANVLTFTETPSVKQMYLNWKCI